MLEYTMKLINWKRWDGEDRWNKLLTSTCGILQKEVWATQTL
jgi:hypothetical protein